MSEFDKIKIGFAIGLLAASFAITPLIQNVQIGFALLSINIKIIYAYWGFVILLGLSVYFFALALVGNETFLFYSKKIANLTYTISMLIVPLYLSLFIVKLIADFIGVILRNEIVANIFQWVVSISVGVIANILSSRILKNFRKKEVKEKIEKIVNDEEDNNKKIEELFSIGQYDSVVIQIWKSIELLITKTLLNLDYIIKDKGTLSIINKAHEAELISNDLLKELREFSNIRNKAVHSESTVSKDMAQDSLKLLNKLEGHLSKVTEQCYYCHEKYPITELFGDNFTGAYVCKKCNKGNPDWRESLGGMFDDP